MSSSLRHVEKRAPVSVVLAKWRTRPALAGKPRHIVLTDEDMQFFCRLCAGRAGDEIMLRKASGAPCEFAHQIRPMDETVVCTKPIYPFHGLRHNWRATQP